MDGGVGEDRTSIDTVVVNLVTVCVSSVSHIEVT